MGIGVGILNAFGRGPESQYRNEFERLARAAFAEAPIDTVRGLFGIFSHGGFVEYLVMEGLSRGDAEAQAQQEDYEMEKMFKLAKVDGPGRPGDRSFHALATNTAAVAAKRGHIWLVAGWSEVFKEVRNRNWATDLFYDPESYEQILMRANSRSQYVRDKYAELG